MKQNLLFNQASALGKRLAMVLTMLLTVGIGQAWGADYELVSFSDIKTNDVIIIVGTKSNTAYAMKNTGTPPTPIKVTISNSKITSTATDITFTATNNGDNTITFVSTTSGTLYCTNANNGVKIGSQTGNNTKFSFDSSVNRLKNIGQTRWLGIYNTQDWRCYTSASATNISGTTTTFYRKVTSTPSYTVTATSNNDNYGTVSVSGTTITASPKTGYTYANPAYTVTAGTALVAQSGNTFTVTPSTNCTIRINFTEKVKNTYVDNVQGNSIQTLYDTHSAPSLTDKAQATIGTCEQQHWHFMGWVTEANKENPTDANIVKANTSVTANGTTYYAVWAKGTTTGGGSTSKQYSFDITPSNFNSTSYAANNNEKTSTAKASDGSTLSVKWTSNQVMLQSSAMQWQKSAGYIYNSTDLGTINSVTVTKSAGTFTTYYGTSKQPSSSTTVGNGYFQIKVGSATGQTSKVTITFTKTTQGAQTTTYSDYITSCTTETAVSLNPNGGTGSMADVTTQNGTLTLPKCTFTREGYTFAGWATSASGEVAFVDEEVVSNWEADITELFAKWTEKPLTNYRTFCDVVCDAYSFHTGTGEKETWLKEAIECFTKEGGYEHEWQIKNYIVPADDKFFVGNYGYFYNDNLGIGGVNGKSRSVVSDWGNMYLAPAMDEHDALGTPRLGHAKGTLRIFEDSNWDNLFVGFIPDGYKLKFGNEEYTFAMHNEGNREYRSEVVLYNSTNTDKNVSVGVVDANSDYVATNHTDTMRHIFLNTGGTTYWEADNVDNFALYDITNETFTCLMHKTGYPNIYEGWVPTTCVKIIFVRLKSSTIDWSNAHNQTVDITLDADKNLYTINNWNQSDNKSGGAWSVYERYGQFAMHDNSKSKNWYVHFVPHYVLTYNKNADDATGTMDIQTVAVDATNKGVVVADCGFTRPGYEFKNWRKDNTSTYYAPNGSNSIELSADITLYAQWTAKKITITWDANGGSVTPTSSTYTYNGATITPPTPTRANYIFNGWFTAATDGTKITEVGTNNKPTEDVTYYAQWTEKATPTFAWSAAKCTAALEADNTFPTLSNPNNLDVTYSSSKTDIAKIDENGDVILGAVGETEITATGAETATHKSATTTYKLIVVESNCRWVEVTDNTTLEDGDEVVITMCKDEFTWTISNKKNTSTAPTANDITANIQGNYLTTVSDEYKWVIEKNNANLTFYSYSDNANYLYCTNADNGVRVGTGTAKVFVVDGNYLKNIETTSPRYVGISFNTNPYTWRCYTGTTGVIANETLKFYKRECLDSEHYWVTWDAGEGTWTDGSSKKLESNEVGATITAPAENPTREGYRFDGWEPTPGTMPAQNATFTAKWTQMHTITWMVGNNSVLTEKVANTTGVTKTPGDDIADDAIGDCANTFMGWSEKSAGSTPQDVAYYDDLRTAAAMKAKHTSVTGDKTFYAVFATATTTPGTSTTTNKTYTHTITATTWDAAGERTLSNVSWALSDNGDYYGYDGTKGQQVGSSKKPAKSMTLTTSGFASASKITSVTINTSGASGTNAKVSVKVGGTSYSCNSNATPSITTSATDYKFTGNATGDIVISWTQTTSTAIYFKSITVEYSNTTTTPDVTECSDYVTNCCALAPATNLTVSGTTSNTATLTWTAPSPTTGITKLQVRNAADDAVVVDDIAVGTTTATITGLTECTSYKYYVASVGDCEVFSNTVTVQPFGSAKTVYYEYNGGSGTETSFTTNCEEQEVTLPTATRAGYDFNGWYTAATGGTKVGDAGGTYNPTTSPITLYAQWTKQIYIISFHANGGTGTMPNQKADENNVIAQLNANQFTRDGYAFVGWNTKANGTGIAYADQATNITLTGNLTLYAQWAAIVTLNDAGTETTTHPATAGGTITLPDGANACSPYEFVGWTSVAIADWNEGIEEPALVASPYKPTQPTTLYAVYKIQSEGNANAFKLSFEGGNGKTYYVGEYGSSPYLRGYSNITEADAVTFIRKKMFPNDDTKYYLYLEHLEEYLYCSSGNLYTTSNEPSESQGWVFHTVGDKIQIQAINQERYLSYSDRDDDRINITTHSTGSQESFNMLSAVTSTYVAAPLCNQEITITFETGNGDFVANAPTTNPLTKSRGDVITLPTCEYPGYEFMGWLKDEQQLDPSDILGTYYTGDYTVDGISQSITFYAYYKAIPEEIEFTGKDDAELLMYYYDGTANYYYAVSHAAERGELSSKQNCFNATTWTFTNVGNMQYYIQDETGKYLGAYSDGDNDLILSATPKVWTFTEVNGLWKMVCENSPSRALMYISTGKTFTNAAISNEGNGAYSYVSLGICPSPTYTTNPVLTQGFTITNTVKVTSASGQKIKAASALILETRNIELPCTFTITAPNITFYDNTGAEVTQLTASVASEQFELHFAYKPTAENTMEYPTVTIVDDELKTYTIKNRIQARSLPNTFAVVAKVGGIWYALPSQGLNSTTPPAAYPVEVDDIADPTAVAAVPANADWSLRQVYEASRVDATKDRFVANGENLVFVNNASPAMALNASTSGNYLLTDAQYANYYQTNPGLYEWTPTTTDLETYQLTNEQRSRTLSVNTATVFGVHATDKAVEQVRFLPIQNRYTPAALQVVEWKENSVVIMYNGNPAQTASVSVNGADAQTTTLSSAQRDIAVYELAATGLAANPTQRLSITIGSEKVILPIPYIVGGDLDDATLLGGNELTIARRQEIAKVADLVVLKDAKLTADGAKSNPYKFRNVTIYGGGKLVIPSEAKGFGVASLTLRAGGITDAGEYDYVYPQFELRGTFTNSAAKINYDYITDYYHWYHLVLPFAGDLTTIKYPTEFYGANVAANNTGSWQIKRYAGEIRATGNYNAWVDIETEGKTSTTAGQGYIFWGAPKKVSVNGGDSNRQKWGIQRITMSVTAPNAMTAENDDKAITGLSSHEDVATSVKDNDQGWNLIGNPYMVNLTDMATTGLHACKLVEAIDPATGKWNGKWEWNDETNIRYLTIPSEHFDTYTAKTVAQSVPLVAGRAFFVQLEGEANGITFAAANRASLMPALAAAQEKSVNIETGIILSSETMQDEVNFWIKDGKTNDYEYNADYPKTPNNNHFNIYGVHTNGDLSWVATGPEYAAESMPIGYQVPAAGTYTLSVSETYYSEDLQALYVTDHAMSPELTVDLMNEPYEFSVNQAETNNERFTVSLKLKSENQGPATGLENIGVQTDGTIKFIYHDKIFILHNGTIYDATGKQVTTIKK